ncbi:MULTISPECIES: transporter substrate-binding domain-containing protein [unclassified Brucella]|jgi:polar amino acid transport system substrate-binding protein|uniref:transporter substrate-binding domain-containing protein n=1 Tax=Brucella TaxID=234 RepID=UPI000DDCBF03|nr:MULTISPECIES: transporter substrate-binding domain-containing protein [unclassified Brucella]GLU27756.1 amino acid ABC transporter [Brucella sp. NBRC 12950]
MKRHLLSIAVAACWLASGISVGAQPAPKAPDFFNQKERLALPSLQGLNRLRFVTTLDFPPFNALNEAGQLSGYNIDLAKALCSQMGLSDICQIEAVPWNELEAKLESGEAEAIIAGLSVNAQSRQKFVFTRAYMRFPARFITKKANSFSEPAAISTRGKDIGVVAGSAHEQLLKAYFPQAVAKPFPDRAALLASLQKGEITAAFDDGMSLSFWLESDQAHDCCVFTDGPYLAPQYLGSGLTIAVAQKNAALAIAFNSALQSLQQQGKLTELYLRYFPTSFY